MNVSFPAPGIKWAIIDKDGFVVDGAYGWALGETERDAWERALDPCQDWTVRRAVADGDRCVPVQQRSPDQ